MNQKSSRVFSSNQQNKFRQLQQEVSALEEQVRDALSKQLSVSDRTAKRQIKLAHDTRN